MLVEVGRSMSQFEVHWGGGVDEVASPYSVSYVD